MPAARPAAARTQSEDESPLPAAAALWRLAASPSDEARSPAAVPERADGLKSAALVGVMRYCAAFQVAARG